MNTLTFAFFLEAPDRPFLSPTKIANVLHLQLGELAAAAGVHRDTLTACPESPRVQAFLHDILRVLNEAQGTISPDIPPIAWMLNEPYRHSARRPRGS